MILINTVILFITKLYTTKIYNKNYLKSDDYTSYIINKNSTYNLMNNTSKNYYGIKKYIFKKNTIEGFYMKNITYNLTDNRTNNYGAKKYIFKKNKNNIIEKFDMRKNITYNLMNNTTNNYCAKKYIFKKDKNNIINEFDGFDMRKNISDNISTYNISVFFYKKTLLDILNNNNININSKLSHIEKYNIIFNEKKCYNIYAGGLMKDWNF